MLQHFVTVPTSYGSTPTYDTLQGAVQDMRTHWGARNQNTASDHSSPRFLLRVPNNEEDIRNALATIYSEAQQNFSERDFSHLSMDVYRPTKAAQPLDPPHLSDRDCRPSTSYGSEALSQCSEGWNQHVEASYPSFLCPITRELMSDPVCAADGHSYELAAIDKWMQTSNKSPITGLDFGHRNLVTNHALRCSIREFLQRSDFLQQPQLHEDRFKVADSLREDAKRTRLSPRRQSRRVCKARTSHCR